MPVDDPTPTREHADPRRRTPIVPGLATARDYRRSWLRHDLVAGLVLTALLVPQGMAYAQLAGLPPVLGVYATMVPLVAYALLGPSRILVLGPDSAIAPVVAATIIPLAGSDTGERVELAGALALLVGGFCVLAALIRLGFLTDLLSKPIRLGYLAGIVATVLADQLPALVGIDAGSGSLLDQLRAFGDEAGQADLVTGVIGVGTLVVILALRRVDRRIPGVLIGVVGATIVTWAFGLADRVATVGALPQGLPRATVPSPGLEELGHLALPALALALLAFADTSVLSRSYASRLGERVDQNRELLALGGANLATGLFQGFPISSSSSRTPVAEAAGARTQVAGVVAALGLAVVLVAGAGLLADLPQSALAAVIVASVITLVDLPGLHRLAHVNHTDFALSLAAFFAVALVGVLPGIGVAIGLSLVAVLARAWRPYSAVLGRITGRKGYHDTRRHPEGQRVPGLVLFRFDAPLFFANAEVFRERVEDAVDSSPTPARVVVVAAEPITDVDSTAADVLAELHQELSARGIGLWFAELKGPAKDDLERYGLLDRLGSQRFYSTIGRAVHAYVDEHDVDWDDWEEVPDE